MRSITTLFFLLALLAPLTYVLADTANITVTVSVLECNDGLDNDGDTLIDYPDDLGCSGPNDDDETDLFECNDGVDNDSDGDVDYPADIGCSSATDDDETNPVTTGGGGGGGGGSTKYFGDAAVEITGSAFPLSTIVVLRNGNEAVRSISGPDAKFRVSIKKLSGGTHTLSVYGIDNNGYRSALFSFPVTLSAGTKTEISGVFLSPTFTSDKSKVKQGDPVKFFGSTVPDSEIVIRINSENQIEVRTLASDTGFFLLNYNTTNLEIGHHEAKTRSENGNDFSDFGKIIDFEVGNVNVLRPQDAVQDTSLRGDLNGDGRVNLIDFSIASFWYRLRLSVQLIDAEKLHLNGDGRIDLVDLSIMASNWTG